MAYLIELPTFQDERGALTVVEKILPFEIKRFYYIYDVTSKRGGHRHRKTKQVLLCLGGSCEIYVNNGNVEHTYLLDSHNQCLFLEAEDWHTMDNFSKGAILMVFASEFYDVADYIDEPY
ncbi:MAG: FdtA/QdtA family cupin domain-containing protein [Aliivibrio sp.]|uniref:sugar 3,4-ketoisomerase n=1 Tax=Aliivibrio sp. TaxID=1872443 RepID=UPI001A4DCFAB|nr:FdtA/QdtA family cupin domain-containing protein [Aliivibrio sp.]